MNVKTKRKSTYLYFFSELFIAHSNVGKKKHTEWSQ